MIIVIFSKSFGLNFNANDDFSCRLSFILYSSNRIECIYRYPRVTQIFVKASRNTRTTWHSKIVISRLRRSYASHLYIHNVTRPVFLCARHQTTRHASLLLLHRFVFFHETRSSIRSNVAFRSFSATLILLACKETESSIVFRFKKKKFWNLVSIKSSYLSFPSSLRSDNFPCYFEAILPPRFSRDTIAIKRNDACSRFIPDRDQRETLSRKRVFRWLALKSSLLRVNAHTAIQNTEYKIEKHWTKKHSRWERNAEKATLPIPVLYFDIIGLLQQLSIVLKISNLILSAFYPRQRPRFIA